MIYGIQIEGACFDSYYQNRLLLATWPFLVSCHSNLFILQFLSDKLCYNESSD